MAKKVLIIGGVAGGASVAARVRRLDEQAEIVMFERGPHVSFSNCALPFHLSKIVPKSESLVLMNPEVFNKSYNIEARVNSEVIKINPQEKTVVVKRQDSGETYEESYDTLYLSPGANPIRPTTIAGIDKPHVFTVRNVIDIENIQFYLDDNAVKDVAVIGGGFIGIEVLENLVHAGKKVTLVEAANQVMMPFDEDMAQILHKSIIDNGANLLVSDSLKAIGDESITLASGKTVKAQAVILAIGVKPEVSLATDCGIELGETGAIKVDHNFKTNIADIYAVGDAIEVQHGVTHKPTRLTMAGPAQRQARAAAGNLYGKTHSMRGVIGSSCVQVFDYSAACTGLNEKDCQKEHIAYDFSYVIPGDKVGLMPNANPLFFKLIFAKGSGKILGAQAIGKGNVDKRIDIIATLISMGGTLDDLSELELCYSPLFGTAKDVVNFAALVGLNILNGEFKQVAVTQVRALVEQNAAIIDVREACEYEQGHLVNAKNIPMSEFRARLNEIPKDQPVYLHCRSSQRSYNVIRALQQLGFDNVVNIMGSYLGISFYEYFNDKTQGRQPIVTAYNFN